MSFTDEDAAREAFFEEISDEAIREFTTERLQSFYFRHDDVMRPAVGAMKEAASLLKTGHDAAALVFYASAVEIFLKAAILKPVVYGLVHNNALAESIVEVAVFRTGFLPYEPLLEHLLREIAAIDVKTTRRDDTGTAIIQECKELVGLRNKILHGGAAITQEKAEWAELVAIATYESIVLPLLTVLGLYIFDDGVALTTPYRTTMTSEGFRVSKIPLTFSRAGTE